MRWSESRQYHRRDETRWNDGTSSCGVVMPCRPVSSHLIGGCRYDVIRCDGSVVAVADDLNRDCHYVRDSLIVILSVLSFLLSLLSTPVWCC